MTVTARRRLPAGARARAPIVVERLAQEYPDATTALDYGTPLQLLDGCQHLVAHLRDARVHQQHAVLAGRDRDVAARARQHVDVAVHRHDVEVLTARARLLREAMDGEQRNAQPRTHDEQSLHDGFAPAREEKIPFAFRIQPPRPQRPPWYVPLHQPLHTRSRYFLARPALILS